MTQVGTSPLQKCEAIARSSMPRRPSKIECPPSDLKGRIARQSSQLRSYLEAGRDRPQDAFRSELKVDTNRTPTSLLFCHMIWHRRPIGLLDFRKRMNSDGRVLNSSTTNFAPPSEKFTIRQAHSTVASTVRIVAGTSPHFRSDLRRSRKTSVLRIDESGSTAAIHPLT
jgi:hypothetical protein